MSSTSFLTFHEAPPCFPAGLSEYLAKAGGSSIKQGFAPCQVGFFRLTLGDGSDR